MNVRAPPENASDGRLLAVALTLVLVAALTDCNRHVEPLPVGPTASAALPERVVDARLRRFECDERCWLEVELLDSSVITGWCNAPLCTQWLDSGARLPAALVGRHARIQLRQDKVFVGTEEDRMEAEEFRAIVMLD